mmetsp:Transcript_9987/g.9928  ORF Transcript_9987/g.9928 Transcript_9987/m.9928 type:complete len:95 (+) Transcript_9987:517-801(+)
MTYSTKEFKILYRMVNKFGFGDRFLEKLKRLEKVGRHQRTFNKYVQAQTNEISEALICLIRAYVPLNEVVLDEQRQIQEMDMKLKDMDQKLVGF